MSLATLKRKTNNGNPRNAPISGKGHLGFALNGTLRVPSMGKTTNLGRRQARTPFRGTEPMGHGGGWRGRLNLPTSKVGTYEQNLHFSGLCCTKNDDEIVKTSVKNTKGMIETRYSGTLHSAYNPDRITYDEAGNPIVPPINWVQPIDNHYQHHHTQGQYIMAKHADNDSVSHYIAYLENGPYDGFKYSCNSGFPCSWFVGSKKMIVGHGVSASSGGPYAKTLNGRGAISQSQYLQGAFMKYKNNLPTTLSKQSFPMNVIRNGCDVNAITIEQAIAKGLMPKQHENVICNQENRIDPGICLHHHRYTLTGHDKKYTSYFSDYIFILDKSTQYNYQIKHINYNYPKIINTNSYKYRTLTIAYNKKYETTILEDINDSIKYNLIKNLYDTFKPNNNEYNIYLVGSYDVAGLNIYRATYPERGIYFPRGDNNNNNNVKMFLIEVNSVLTNFRIVQEIPTIKLN